MKNTESKNMNPRKRNIKQMGGRKRGINRKEGIEERGTRGSVRRLRQNQEEATSFLREEKQLSLN